MSLSGVNATRVEHVIGYEETKILVLFTRQLQEKQHLAGINTFKPAGGSTGLGVQDENKQRSTVVSPPAR